MANKVSRAGRYVNLLQAEFLGGSLDFSGDEVVEKLAVYGCALTFLNVDGCSALNYLDAANNQLTEASVDAVLAALNAAGLENGEVYLAEVNSPPSAAGLLSKTALEGKGWTVTVNS